MSVLRAVPSKHPTPDNQADPTQDKDWEEEFEHQFVDRPFEPDGDYSWRLEAIPTNIKSFIAEQIQQAETRGVEKENKAWLDGIRCDTCGESMYPTGLTDTCPKCLEDN